jgi:hypothetical protein
VRCSPWSSKALTDRQRYRQRLQRAQAAKDRLLETGFVLDSADRIAMVAVLEAVLAEPLGRGSTWLNDMVQRTCEAAGV